MALFSIKVRRSPVADTNIKIVPHDAGSSKKYGDCKLKIVACGDWSNAKGSPWEKFPPILTLSQHKLLTYSLPIIPSNIKVCVDFLTGIVGADDGIRTHDINLGKVALYP